MALFFDEFEPTANNWGNVTLKATESDLILLRYLLESGEPTTIQGISGKEYPAKSMALNEFISLFDINACRRKASVTFLKAAKRLMSCYYNYEDDEKWETSCIVSGIHWTSYYGIIKKIFFLLDSFSTNSFNKLVAHKNEIQFEYAGRFYHAPVWLIPIEEQGNGREAAN